MGIRMQDRIKTNDFLNSLRGLLNNGEARNLNQDAKKALVIDLYTKIKEESENPAINPDIIREHLESFTKFFQSYASIESSENSMSNTSTSEAIIKVGKKLDKSQHNTKESIIYEISNEKYGISAFPDQRFIIESQLNMIADDTDKSTPLVPQQVRSLKEAIGLIEDVPEKNRISTVLKDALKLNNLDTNEMVDALQKRYSGENDDIVRKLLKDTDLERSEISYSYYRNVTTNHFIDTLSDCSRRCDLEKAVISPEVRAARIKQEKFINLCKNSVTPACTTGVASNLEETLNSAAANSGVQLISQKRETREDERLQKVKCYRRNLAALATFTGGYNKQLLDMLGVLITKGDNGDRTAYSTAESARYDITSTDLGSHGILGGVTFSPAQSDFLEQIRVEAQDISTVVTKPYSFESMLDENSIKFNQQMDSNNKYKTIIEERIADKEELRNWVSRNSTMPEVTLVSLSRECEEQNARSWTCKTRKSSVQKVLGAIEIEYELAFREEMPGKATVQNRNVA